MEQQNAAPVNHGVLSSTGAVAVGTVGGAAKGAVKAGAGWIVAATVLGAVIGAAVFLPAGGAIASILWGAGFGLIGGTLTSPFAGVIGSVVGGLTGAGRSVNQVSAEKGAANVVQAQVAAYQAQAQAEALAASNDNSKYSGFPAQGAPMNQAGTRISAMQSDGRVNGMELQRA